MPEGPDTYLVLDDGRGGIHSLHIHVRKLHPRVILRLELITHLPHLPVTEAPAYDGLAFEELRGGLADAEDVLSGLDTLGAIEGYDFRLTVGRVSGRDDQLGDVLKYVQNN